MSAAIALVVVAGCGQSINAEPRGSASTSASTTITTTASSTSTTRPGVGTDPIPSDPRALESCDEFPSNAVLQTPSRWWAEPPDGWEVSYAFSELTPSPVPPGGTASTLVRVDAGDVVSATVVVAGSPGNGSWRGGSPETVVRGVPGFLGPERNRGGLTGSTQANWTESGYDLRAVGHGLDEEGLRAVLDASELAEGLVVEAPTGWQLLGAGRSIVGAGGTVIGFHPRGGGVDEYGIAPVELFVRDTAGVPSGSGAPEAIRSRNGPRLASIEGRPALMGISGEYESLVETTTVEGQPVSVRGPLPAEELLRIVGGLVRIEPGNPLLVGVPIGNGYTSGGACRGDR